MSSLKCRPVALFLLVVFLAGCYTWRPTTVSPPELIEQEAPSQLRVTRRSGEQVKISDPQFRADSIIGDEIAVAVDDIREIRVRRFSTGRTLLLVFVAGSIAFAVDYLSSSETLISSPP